MKTALRVAALFAVYSSIGFGGEYAMGLLAADEVEPTAVEVSPEVSPEVSVEPRIVVDVRPTIVSRVQVRHAGACSYELDRELTIPVEGTESLAIRAGAGALHVEGQRDLEEIVVVGRVCASHEEYLDDLDLSVERARGSGDLTLVTRYPEHRMRSSGDNTARIDLTVLIPMGMSVDIDDSSGDIVVSGTGDLRIDDSSGSIRAFQINGALSIDDSSGDLEIEDVAGDVVIDDGSGGLDIRDVQGSVSLRDGSGGIDIAEVESDVLIESDGSGSIDVRNVGGDFRVGRDGSGGIRHSGVEGRVDVPEKRRRGR